MDREIDVSYIIPYYEVDSEKPEVLRKCVKSMKGYDELILVWNDGIGYAKAINKGLALARGKYMVVSNDDILLKKGSLRDLCVPGAVVSPKVNGQLQDFWGCMFCVPRSVYEKVGGLSEIYEISYFDDDDYQFTLKQAGIPMIGTGSVEISHPEGGRTLHQMEGWQERFERNKQKFFDKWHRYP